MITAGKMGDICARSFVTFPPQLPGYTDGPRMVLPGLPPFTSNLVRREPPKTAIGFAWELR